MHFFQVVDNLQALRKIYNISHNKENLFDYIWKKIKKDMIMKRKLVNFPERLWEKFSSSGIDSSEPFHRSLLYTLSKIVTCIQRIFLANCNLTADFFESLSLTKWTITRLFLQNCQINNKSLLGITKINVFDLQYCCFVSDPITNRGISNFLKL